MATMFGSFYTNILIIDVLVIIGSLTESLGNQSHLYIARTMDDISFELDACSVCKDYEPNPTHSLRACSVGQLRDDVYELKRMLGEAFRTYELMINTGIEEEERNGMYTDNKYQTAFTGNKVSWMQKYDTIHSMLLEISLNMTVMKQLLNLRLMKNFLQSLRGVMCRLQEILKLGSLAKEDTNFEITCRRSLVISRNIENARFTNYSEQ